MQLRYLMLLAGYLMCVMAPAFAGTHLPVAGKAVCIGCDLHGHDFRRQDLHARVSGVRMPGSEFRHARFDKVDTRRLLANCIGCDFTHADLHGVDMRGTALVGADFRDAQRCDSSDRCRPVTAAELRTYGHNAFAGALMPQ